MRTIVYEPSFEADAQRLEPSTAQFDSIIEGVIWMLSHSPESGQRIGQTQIWAIPIRRFRNRREELVDWVIYYEFDDEMVKLIAVLENVYDP